MSESGFQILEPSLKVPQGSNSGRPHLPQSKLHPLPLPNNGDAMDSLHDSRYRLTIGVHT